MEHRAVEVGWTDRRCAVQNMSHVVASATVAAWVLPHRMGRVRSSMSQLGIMLSWLVGDVRLERRRYRQRRRTCTCCVHHVPATGRSRIQCPAFVLSRVSGRAAHEIVLAATISALHAVFAECRVSCIRSVSRRHSRSRAHTRARVATPGWKVSDLVGSFARVIY